MALGPHRPRLGKLRKYPKGMKKLKMMSKVGNVKEYKTIYNNSLAKKLMR